MANKKITELVAATTIADADVVPVVVDVATSATTKKMTFANLKAAILASPTLTGTVTATTVNATTLTGAGAGITGLNASNLASGTVPDARFPATLPALSGANLTTLNASNISSGTLASARLPATIAANTTGSAQSLVNGSNSIAIGGGTVITIAAGSGSGVTGVTSTVGAFQQGPNGFPTFSSQAAFIPVRIAGTDYFIRCERWT